MDLRIVKTKKAIKESFLKLRSSLPLEKIKVKDVCEMALINKTTFYKHYEDIYALSNEMEHEATDLVMKCFVEKGEIFMNPQNFIKGLPKALNENREVLQPLFYDNLDKFFILLEKKLKNFYSISENSMEEKILLTFVVGGMLHTLRAMKYEYDCDDTVLADNVSEIVSKIGIFNLDVH